MMNVSDYISVILYKKGWTQAELCKRLNKIEARLGDSRTSVPNISYYVRGYWAFRPKILAKWEVALELPEGTLMNMVAPPLTKEGKEELRETIERLRKLR